MVRMGRESSLLHIYEYCRELSIGWEGANLMGIIHFYCRAAAADDEWHI